MLSRQGQEKPQSLLGAPTRARLGHFFGRLNVR